MCAFTIGISLNDNGSDIIIVDNAIDNASVNINNIKLTNTLENEEINLDGMYLTLEKYIQFVGILGVETMRAGVHFGYDNPDYFEPETIISIVKFIVILIIFSLLIKPIMYLIVLIILFLMWLLERIKKRKLNKQNFKDNE